MRMHPLVRCLAAATITVSFLAGCGTSAGPTAPGSSAVAPSVAPTLASTPTTAPSIAPTPSPTTAPTEAPTAPATPTPTPAVTKADPATSLRIDAPYKLGRLDDVTSAMVDAGFSASLGSLADAVEIGTRQVTRKGTAVGFVMLVKIPGLPGTSATAVVDGAATSLTGKVSRLRIAGHDVRVGMSSGQWAAVTGFDDGLLMVFAGTRQSTIDVTTALLRASR